ncbi:MAG TPA: hypothetical protein VD837_10865 [Terriglobales bacterium]|nr:hypothetical protein [Terriglobales bacterium]
MKCSVVVVTLVLIVAFSACSTEKPAEPASQQKQQQATPKPPESHTGREVFQRLYVAARGWAPDVKPFRLQSEPTGEVNGQNGKAAVWRASFASPSRRGLKTYLWSGTGEDRGVTPGTEDTYNPNNSATQIFDIAFLKTDSDKAFSVAQEHGGEKLLKKDPKQPVFYVLEWNGSQNKLIWHVIYGTSRQDAKLAVSVDATIGQFLRVEK